MNRAPTISGPLATPFATAASRIDPLDLARSLIVLGSAAALILAGQALPF